MTLDPEDILVPRYEGDINEHMPMDRGFQNRDISKERVDIVFENLNTEHIIVSFGGCGFAEDGDAQYAFANIFARYDVSSILLRDQFGAWFLNGVSGVSTNVLTTVSALKDHIKEANASKVICTGSSGGGFAAILFGNLLEVDYVLAINPQTLLEPGIKCIAHGSLYRLKWCDENEEEYRDLQKLPTSSKTTVDIIYGVDEETDLFHSGRMRDVSNVVLLPTPGTHGTAAVAARDDGTIYNKLNDLEPYRKRQK